MTVLMDAQLTSLILLFVVVGAILLLVHRLQASEARFRILAENTGDIVCLHDSEGGCLYVSPSAERVLGHTPPACPGVHAHPDDVVLVRRALSQIASGGGASRFTFRALRVDGEVVWLETIGRPVVGRRGEITGVIAASRDVTDRKRVEDLYRVLADSLPLTSFILYDRDFRIHVAAGPLINRSGYSRESMEGRGLPEVFRRILDREQMPLAMARWEAPLDGRYETSEFALGGFLYEVQYVPVSVAGSVVSGLIVSRDVTAQRKGEAALLERTEDLERSNRDLEQFADIASHELKTPLRHISGFTELLAEEYEGMLSDEADEYIAGVLQGVREMTGVIEALLRYSRAKSNENRMQAVDLGHLLRQVVTSLDGRARDVGGRIEIAWDTLPTVRGDPVLLKQLVENLVWNGLKFSQPDPVVRVWAARDLLEWVITVEDNGPGVSEEHRELIFQMFKRSRTDVEGSGIGLALCKKIVGIHRGRIWVEPGAGPPDRPGAVFRFTLSVRARDEVTRQ